jgi:hypothetical protein
MPQPAEQRVVLDPGEVAVPAVIRPSGRHPLTKDYYTPQPDGTVLVETALGEIGVFTSGAAWVSGPLKYVDANFIRWVLDTSPPSTAI